MVVTRCQITLLGRCSTGVLTGRCQRPVDLPRFSAYVESAAPPGLGVCQEKLPPVAELAGSDIHPRSRQQDPFWRIRHVRRGSAGTTSGKTGRDVDNLGAW